MRETKIGSLSNVLEHYNTNSRKKKKCKFLTATVIFLLLEAAGCGTNQKDTSQLSIQPTVKETQTQDKLSSLPERIQDILYNDGEFYDVERKQTYTKSSYKVDIWYTDNDIMEPVYWDEYLVLDLDQDGQTELLVRVKNKNSSEPITKIFDVEQDTVYCYSYVYRATKVIFADGVIAESSGAANNGFYTLKFNNGRAEEITVARMEGHGSECDYFIGEEKVSGEKYWTVEEKYDYENGEKWIAFKEQNQEQQVDTSNLSPEPTITIKETQDKLSSLPEQIQDILYSNGEFYDIKKKQTYTKSSYQIDVCGYEESKDTVYWKKYLVLDLDKDGQMELLVRLSNYLDDIEATCIFDVQQDKVYCYSYLLDETKQVYTDGTIYRSGWDLSGNKIDNAFFSIKFKGEKASEAIIAESKSKTGGFNYFIGKKKVSPDEYYAYTEKYNSHDEEKWLTFDNK